MCFACLMCYFFLYEVNKIVKKKVYRTSSPTRQPANEWDRIEFWACTPKLTCPIFKQALGGSGLYGRKENNTIHPSICPSIVLKKRVIGNVWGLKSTIVGSFKLIGNMSKLLYYSCVLAINENWFNCIFYPSINLIWDFDPSFLDSLL
jgi:hypothetical protein